MTWGPKGLIPGLLVAVLLAGCSAYTDLDPGTIKNVTNGHDFAVLEKQSLDVGLGEDAFEPPADYLIGPGDILFVNVNGRPELGSPVSTGGNNQVRGSRVDHAGRIHLPLVGGVPVGGLSVVQAQEKIVEAFRPYLKKPWVVVEIAEYRSQPLYLLGQFNKPGTYYMDRSINLMEGLALGNGVNDTANLRSARLVRNGKTIPVDIFRLLQEGDQEQNTWLKAGDTLFVPDDKNQNVFVFGAVTKPGAVTMPNGRLTLGQALSSAGLDETAGHPRYLRIIRSLSPTRGQLLVVDLTRILKGEAIPYPLMEGDILYVPRSGVGTWNQAINAMLPSLQAVSAVLQPFVQIKFLSEDD
jgi:polysaccharide export outer membrane protein